MNKQSPFCKWSNGEPTKNEKKKKIHAKSRERKNAPVMCLKHAMHDTTKNKHTRNHLKRKKKGQRECEYMQQGFFFSSFLLFLSCKQFSFLMLFWNRWLNT